MFTRSCAQRQWVPSFRQKIYWHARPDCNNLLLKIKQYAQGSMFFISTHRGPRRLAPALLAWLLVTVPFSMAAPEDAAGTERCRGCHDYAPAEHVERLLLGSHGISTEAGFQRGCEDCHGASADHAAAPRENSPQTSFGPRWSASSAAQAGPCLACHERNTADNWQHALHMFNNLTCVTCHDIHSEEDKVLVDGQQAQVCTVCHKVQKQGIHGRADNLEQDPPCSSCRIRGKVRTAPPPHHCRLPAG